MILKKIVKFIALESYHCNYLVVFGFFFLWISNASAQVISGMVVDAEDNSALPGATVRISQDGTVTNELGYFRLSVKSLPSTIIVSYVGYESWNQFITSGIDSIFLDIRLGRSIHLLEVTTVTASKYGKPLGESTVSLEVLPNRLVEGVNATSLDESLDKIPGVQIIGGQANIRGGAGFSYGAGSRVMLLVDDLPILSADAGFPHWDDLPVENIQQVEILKGASSALYGSSALNGIINVRTAYPTSEPQTKIATFYTVILPPKDQDKQWWSNAPGTFGVQASHTQNFSKFDLVLGGYYLNRKLAYQDGDLRYGRINFNTLYRINDRLSIGINGNFNQGKGMNFFYWENEKSGAYRGAMGTDNASDRFRYNLDPSIKWFLKNGIRHKLVGRFYAIDNKVSNNRSNKTKSQYSEYQFSKDWEKAGMNLSMGAVYNYAKVNAELYGDTTFTSNSFAIYAQWEKKFLNKLTISLGSRLEQYKLNSPQNVHGRAIDPALNQELKPVFRVGLNYQIGAYSFLRGSWGQGFRFPTIAEKFIQTSLGPTQISPNIDLISETGWSSEIGWKQGVKLVDWQGFFDVSAFWSEYADMMEFLFVSLNDGFQSTNVGGTRIAGFELSLTGQSKFRTVPVSLLMGYTFLDPVFQDFTMEDELRSTADYNILKYRSKHHMKLDLQVDFKRLDLGISAQYVSKVEAIDAIFELVIPGLQSFRMNHQNGYTLLDFRANYHFQDWTLSFLVKNLLNQEYAVRPGLLEDPINLTTKISWNF